MKDDDVKWIVNDLAELGVLINGECFFMYKGQSYQGGKYYREVGKREFGECCHPWSSIELKKYGNLESRPLVILPDSYINFHDEGLDDWKLIENRSLK